MIPGYGILPMWNSPSAFGDYTNFMPSMMGLPAVSGYGYGYGNESIFGNGMFGGYGMNPMAMMMEYPIYMQKLQNQLERENLQHTSFMHKGMIDNQIKAHEESLSGVIQKLTTDGAVQEKLTTFYDKIREGDQNGAAQEYDKLKNAIYATFGKELESKGIHVNRADEARRIIETMYADVVSASSADGPHTLRADIDRYCSGAFESGFINGYNNEKGQRYKDELINHIYGERINNYDSKESRQNIGQGLGTTASVVVSGVEGAALGGAAGLSAAGLIYGVSKVARPNNQEAALRRSHFWKAGKKEIYFINNNGKKITGKQLRELGEKDLADLWDKKGGLLRKSTITEKEAKQLNKGLEKLINKGSIGTKTVKIPGWGRKAGKYGLLIGLVAFVARDIFKRADK